MLGNDLDTFWGKGIKRSKNIFCKSEILIRFGVKYPYISVWIGDFWTILPMHRMYGLQYPYEFALIFLAMLHYNKYFQIKKIVENYLIYIIYILINVIFNQH